MTGEVFVIIAFLASLMIFAFLATFFVIKHEPEKPIVPSEPALVQQPVTWSEIIRGNPSQNGFPPCYTNDNAAKAIYGILKSNNSVQKYYGLLDVLSILLCLEQAQIKQCKDTNIKDRQVQITGMGGDPDDQDSKEYASTFFKNSNTTMHRLLVASVYLIRRQLQIFETDYNINRVDKDQVKGHVYSFLSTHLPQLAKLCV